MNAALAILPVDVTGNSITNLVSNELHQITGGSQSVLRPQAGSFYEKSMSVYSVNGTGGLSPMTINVDYKLVTLDVGATSVSGLTVYNFVLILNPNLTSLFSINYQAFGGENNLNISALENNLKIAGINAPIEFSNIINVPTDFTPIYHTHDIADVYGMEYITTFLNNIKNAIITDNTKNSKNKEVTNAANELNNLYSDLGIATINGIRDHIDNVAYMHVMTPSGCGLSNLSNYGFTPIGNETVYFASPNTLLNILSNLPSSTPDTHKTLTNNPHLDNVKNIPNLNNIVNLPIITDYTLNTNAYTKLTKEAVGEVYLGPWALTNFVFEYDLNQQQIELSNGNTDGLNNVNNDLNFISTIGSYTSILINNTNNLLSTINDNISTLNANIPNINKELNIYYLLNNNAYYAAALEKVMMLEYANYNTGLGITENGYYSVPDKLQGLTTWLSANNPKNEFFTDIRGNVRLVKLVDYASNREFSNVPNLSPIFKESLDKSESLLGNTNGNVMSFTPGLCLNLTKGQPITLMPNSTIIILSRAGDINTINTALINSKIDNEYILVNNTNNQGLVINANNGWNPISSPNNSSLPLTTNIVVGSINENGIQSTWYASSQSFNTSLYTKGLSNVTTGTYTKTMFDSIGNGNFNSNNYGEISEIIIYNRQLSGLEIQVVTQYLQLRYSQNTALAVDYSVLNAFK